MSTASGHVNIYVPGGTISVNQDYLRMVMERILERMTNPDLPSLPVETIQFTLEEALDNVR